MTVEIRDADLKIEYYRASGPGGQHRNTTDSGVRVRHLPTGIVSQATESRSQIRNRETALRRLAELLERRARTPKKRHSTSIPFAERERRLTTKKQRSLRKKQRSLRADE